jgi:AGCS family alanine or glycine:cation symporter
MGGAMEYLSRGFAERGQVGFGKFMAVLFCICAIGGCIGGGNMFQVSQASAAVAQRIPFFESNSWVFGLILAIIVAMVIIGGIRRIAHVAEAVVPTMVIIYVGACLWIILSNITHLPDVLGQILSGAFTHEAGIGGIIGAIVQGFKRAVFSSEAGIGSAAIAHATAKSEYPVRQGIVALMEPFIDTVVICTMTAMVIVITGVVTDPANASIVADKQGAALTSVAFGSVISWFPVILTVSVVLFAFSTMISWSYYGERCWSYLFGENTSMVFKIIFVLLILVGSIASAANILNFSDLIFLSLAIPNYIGLYVMHGMVKQQLGEYETKLRAGEFDKASPATA